MSSEPHNSLFLLSPALRAGEGGLKDRTTIIISHHLASLSDVGRIVVMDKGTIVEDGSYQDLLKKDGVFCRLYRQQSK